MYQLEVVFPSGRFYAARADDPEQPEWPPHPGRLLSALVAAAGTQDSGEAREAGFEALRWLEQQPAPHVAAPEAKRESAPAHFVPPGDELKIKKVPKGKEPEEPFSRVPNRHERYFPCAYILGPPRVLYRWPDATPAPVLAKSLDALAAFVTHVGTSHSLAIVRSVEGDAAERTDFGPNIWRPHEKGRTYLRVAERGRVDELIRAYDTPAKESVLRRAPAAFERLRPYVAGHPQQAIDSPEFRRLLVLRIPRVTLLPADGGDPRGDEEQEMLRLPSVLYEARDAELLARALRNAVMSLMPNPLPAEVHGHGPSPHVGWWLLPDVRPPRQPNAEHARGRMLGFGLALPRTLSQDDERSLLHAVRLLEERGVHVPDGRDVFPKLVAAGEALPMGLRRSTWTRPSKVWTTVTPIIPNRLPSRPTEARIRKSLVQAAVAAGLPEPSEVVPSQTSYFCGAPSTQAVKGKLPRYHAVYRWETPVRGPVALGRMRFFGGGVMRPAKELERAVQPEEQGDEA